MPVLTALLTLKALFNTLKGGKRVARQSWAVYDSTKTKIIGYSQFVEYKSGFGGMASKQEVTDAKNWAKLAMSLSKEELEGAEPLLVIFVPADGGEPIGTPYIPSSDEYAADDWIEIT